MERDVPGTESKSMSTFVQKFYDYECTYIQATPYIEWEEEVIFVEEREATPEGERGRVKKESVRKYFEERNGK